ncbi:MAG: kynureninase [Anaerolineales bacterium]|jgi:kynureninase|nr:kynureninase [Anaerolineales bacterium]
MTVDISRAYAQKLDETDELAAYRSLFFNTNPNLIYLDGNSLGKLPLRTIARIEQVVKDEWGANLIRSWGHNWFAAPLSIGEKIAQLVGAAPGQVAVSDSTTINLYKLAMSALMLRPERKKIISDTLNFPSDLYMLQGCAHVLGGKHQIHLLESADGLRIETEKVLQAIDSQTALVTLSHVVFKSGYMYDAKTITDYAHQKGALVLWDLSHAVGAVPVALDDWNADFATGCTYKYLNGGPGAPAFLYVRSDLQQQALSPIWGWFGDHAPFNFDLNYQPAAGIQRFLCGTPPLLSTLAMEQGVDLLLEAGLPRLRKKSILLTSYLIDLFDALLAPLGFSLGTPREAQQRGSHVSLRHKDGYRINRALIEDMDVLPDFREPDNIRLGLAPIYTSFEEVWESVHRIQSVVTEKRYQRFAETRQAVT